MRTENGPIYDLWIECMDADDMRFDEILPLFHDPEVDDTSRQRASFDEDPFAIAHSCESYSSVAYLVYFYP